MEASVTSSLSPAASRSLALPVAQRRAQGQSPLAVGPPKPDPSIASQVWRPSHCISGRPVVYPFNRGFRGGVAQGRRVMAHRAEETRFARSGRDDAADASRFFSRVGYAALAIGAPIGVVVDPLALFIVFPIGVAMIVMAAVLQGKPGLVGRGLRAFTSPTFLALIA